MSYTPNNVTDCIENTEIALEKSLLILGDLTNKYTFTIQPKANLNTANHEAQLWLWEYNRIITFIEIIQDYVFIASELIEHAKSLELPKGGANNGE